MSFELLCISIIAILFGTILAFGGYRFFLFLLPLWGFFFGFGLGAQAVQALLGQGFFGTVTSWVVGFVLALIFALFSYLFYYFGVAIIAASLGYGLGYAIMALFGLDDGLIPFLVGVALAVLLAFLTLRYNLAKYVIIIGSALAGAAIAVGTLSSGVGGIELARLSENPLGTLFGDSILWLLLFLGVAIAGMIIQFQANRNWYAEPYPNRI